MNVNEQPELNRMSDDRKCRICYQNLPSAKILTVPCGCRGSIEQICIDCLMEEQRRNGGQCSICATQTQRMNQFRPIGELEKMNFLKTIIYHFHAQIAFFIFEMFFAWPFSFQVFNLEPPYPIQNALNIMRVALFFTHTIFWVRYYNKFINTRPLSGFSFVLIIVELMSIIYIAVFPILLLPVSTIRFFHLRLIQEREVRSWTQEQSRVWVREGLFLEDDDDVGAEGPINWGAPPQREPEPEPEEELDQEPEIGDDELEIGDDEEDIQ